MYLKGDAGSSAANNQKQQYESQFLLYLCDPAQPIDRCPLTWWAQNHARFPAVAACARKYLTIPASAMLSEQILSSDEGRMLTKGRFRLDEEHADQILFLSKNIE